MIYPFLYHGLINPLAFNWSINLIHINFPDCLALDECTDIVKNYGEEEWTVVAL